MQKTGTGEKTCTRCKETKSTTKFNRLYDAHHWWCKDCMKVYRDQPEVKAKRAEYTKRWRAANPDYWK